jgi:hypothetical protein
MTIEELEEKFQQVRQLRWLEEIAHDYREQLELIAKNPDYYTITGVRFSCRGSERGFNLNPHHPIPLQYLREGLADALSGLEREIETLKAEIQR